jgi:branched-chain amino acid transport system permease protein
VSAWVSTEIVVAGLATGALYASSALTLSITYRASRVLNLAQGSVALMAASIVAKLDGLPVGLAVVIALAASVVMGLGLEATTRNPDPLARLTAVVGWLLALSGILATQTFHSVESSPRYPLGRGTLKLGGVALGYDQVALIVLAVALPIVLAWFLSSTPSGAKVMAVADAPESSRMIGLDVTTIRRVIWAATGGLVGVIGVLAAPTIGLQPTTALVLLAGGLAAALLGGVDSLIGPAVVGFALGQLKAVVGGHVSPALADAILISVVILALGLRRQAVGGPAEART